VAKHLSDRTAATADNARTAATSALVVGGGDIEGIDDVDVGISLANEDSPQWLKNLDDRLEKNVQSLSGDRGEFIELLTEYLPQMMFLLLPVLALALM
jgi:hypothetical protein